MSVVIHCSILAHHRRVYSKLPQLVLNTLVEEDGIRCRLPAHATTFVRNHQAGLREQAFGGYRRG